MARLTLSEVILENFMSYEYARVQLNRGLNLISGPNGAGKSSILLAISVATGQSYTERSRKLSDLIRRGKETARVTLVLNNSAEDGKRPVPIINSDLITVSRYLKKDGTYWFEVNSKEASKFDVNRLFKSVGMNPDNMLIIMHQNMIEEFAITSPEEKLRMVEEAVGFLPYRKAIFDAEEKLGRILGEEEATNQLLKSAEQTLAYWRDLNERHEERKRLKEKKTYLERELAWAQIIKNEKAVTSLEERIRLKSAQLEDIKGAIVQRKKEAEALWLDYLTEKERLRELFSSQALRERAASGDRLDSLVKSYVAVMVDEAVMRYREGELEQELRDLYSDLEEAKRLLEDSRVSAVGAGDRIQTSRTILEISEEIRFVNAHLLSLGEVPEDAPSMYQAYQKTYQELKQKASVVGENRKHLIEEIAERKRVWKEILEKLILEINPVYRSVLSKVGGTGDVRLSNMDDPEKAGLEVTVGFRGASPVLLDAYAQSGGERAVATMAFLLALQHQLKSPVRAVDEFDVHMDPFNREAMMRMLFAFMRENSDVQFIVITPSQLSAVGEFANIIFVQNVHGRSEVARAAAPST